jgi:hypothetical protein
MISAASRATVHNSAFSACQTPVYILQTEGSVVQYSTIVFVRVRFRNREFTLVRRRVTSEVK